MLKSVKRGKKLREIVTLAWLLLGVRKEVDLEKLACRKSGGLGQNNEKEDCGPPDIVVSAPHPHLTTCH